MLSSIRLQLPVTLLLLAKVTILRFFVAQKGRQLGLLTRVQLPLQTLPRLLPPLTLLLRLRHLICGLLSLPIGFMARIGWVRLVSLSFDLLY